MPILLTTPFNPGTFDPGHTYPRAKVISFANNTEAKVIRVSVDFGDMVEGAWESGFPNSMRMEGREKLYIVHGTNYDVMVAELPGEGETVYDAVKRLLYAYLVTNVSELAGTVE
jgi:hypothetical protein